MGLDRVEVVLRLFDPEVAAIARASRPSSL
jgi:hypothetical protein